MVETLGHASAKACKEGYLVTKNYSSYEHLEEIGPAARTVLLR